MNLSQRHYKLAGVLPLLALCLIGCAGTKRLDIDNTFPVPLMEKVPVNLGIHLDEDITNYVHTETIDKHGTWEVSVGAAQQSLFDNLAKGLFEGHRFVQELTVEPPYDGVLKPTIEEVQFSIPTQTRSNYYEVWIRYSFTLFDKAGTPVGDWKLPAYGKASKKNFGSSSNGLRAAAIAACRDAMAFFSLNFNREPAIQAWIAAGKPLMPVVPSTTPQIGSQTAPTTTTPNKSSKNDPTAGGQNAPANSKVAPPPATPVGQTTKGEPT